MTVCVAALCEKGKTLLLAADRMVGVMGGVIEAEPDVSKIYPLNSFWWALVSGNDCVPAFEIIEGVKAQIPDKPLDQNSMMSAVEKEYRRVRLAEAESKYLAPLGFTHGEILKKGRTVLGKRRFADILGRVEDHEFSISLLIAGFDRSRKGHIFTVDSDVKRGKPQPNDAEGYAAVGSGGFAANYMMSYREYDFNLPVHKAIYSVFEGKYFGELATGVGVTTDLFIVRPGKKLLIVDKKREKLLVRLVRRRGPRRIKKPQSQELKDIWKTVEKNKQPLP